MRRRYDEQPELLGSLFRQMDQIALQGAEALRGADYKQLGSLMNACQGF